MTSLIAIAILLFLAPAAWAQPAPPAGFVWQQTFSDDMNSFDKSKWNGLYATTLYCNNGGCPQNYNGLSTAGGLLVLSATVNYSNFTDLTGRTAENTNGLFSQRYGYFEVRSKLPHDNAGEGDGLWSAFYAFPVGKQAFFDIGCGDGVNDSKAEELDIEEVIGATTNMRQVRFTAHDRCFNEFGQLMPAAPGADLSAAYHTYGLYWKNDGSPHGTVCGYFDGVQQGSCYTLEPSSKLWDNGIFLLNQLIPCPPNNVPFGGGAPCHASTSNANPLLVDYTKAWQLVASNATPTPTPTPTVTPSPTPTPAGCTATITAPPIASGTITINVATANCSSVPTDSFERLYLAGKQYDFKDTLSLDTTALPDGAYPYGLIVWDHTGTVKQYQLPDGATLTINNHVPCSATCTGVVATGKCVSNCACGQ